jgi:predicted MFS family arabinose efflux permease
MNTSLAALRTSRASMRSGWWIPAGLSLGPACTIGLARFAYALILPAMRDDLGWSFAQAGMLSTANALGYLVGALLAAPLISRTGTVRGFAAALGFTAVALLLSAATLDFSILVVLRVVAGLAGAVAFIGGAGLAARAGRSTSMLAIYFGGAGLGIVASSLAVPALLDLSLPHAWRLAWLALGLLVAASVPIAVAAAERIAAPPGPESGPRVRWSARRMAPIVAGFVLFGGGYISPT